MTQHEKAVAALNRRIERLQAELGETEAETARRFLFQSLVVTLGLGEALNDYIKRVGEYAQRRHAEVKQANDALGAQHAELLQSGKGLLEKFKADPTNRALRKEIERAQHGMEAIQKNLRRGTNALQRDVAPSIAMIDKLADSVRRLSEADEVDGLKRLLRTIIGQAHELYASQPDLPAKDVIDAAAWENSALAEIDQAVDRYDAYARAVYQAVLASELMTLAVSDAPPQTGKDAIERANEAVTRRVKEITARFSVA